MNRQLTIKMPTYRYGKFFLSFKRDIQNLHDDVICAQDKLWLTCLGVINYVGLGL